MIQSISYNLTDNESTLLKVSAQKFKEPVFLRALASEALFIQAHPSTICVGKVFPRLQKARYRKLGINCCTLYQPFIII